MIINFLGNYREGNAEVLKTGKSYLDVGFCPSQHNESQCQNCTLCSKSGKTVKLRVLVSDSSIYQTGQTLKIKRFVFHEALSAFILFGLPLISAISTFFIFPEYRRSSNNDTGIIILCFAGFIAGFIAAAAIDRLGRHFFRPEILSAGQESC